MLSLIFTEVILLLVSLPTSPCLRKSPSVGLRGDLASKTAGLTRNSKRASIKALKLREDRLTEFDSL